MVAPPLKILIVESRPKWLKEKLGQTEKVEPQKSNGIVETKPEYKTLVVKESVTISKAFHSNSSNVIIETISNGEATKENITLSLRKKWDIVHFDCVVDPNAQICVSDGTIHPQALREILKNKKISLLVLMDCDSLQIAVSALNVGVKALLAITDSIPVNAAEQFCKGFYSEIANGKTLSEGFIAGKELASVEFDKNWIDELFVLDGDSDIFFKL